MLHRTADQSSSYCSNSRPGYLNTSTPSMHSTSSPPVRPNGAYNYLSAITTSLLRYLILVFLSQRAVLWCLMSCPSSIYIPHKSQQGSGYAPSWTTTTLDRKWRYMQCLRGLPAPCATVRNPGTVNFTSCNTPGKENTSKYGCICCFHFSFVDVVQMFFRTKKLKTSENWPSIPHQEDEG